MNTSPSSRSLTAPDIVLKDIVSLKVPFVDFKGNDRRGVIEVHVSIQEDVIALFNYLYEIRFPLTSVTPLSAFNNDDDVSMEANNSYAFGFRTVALDSTRISLHGYGVAIDLNPALNPYTKDEKVLPLNATYIPGNPGVFDSTHPVVIFMKSRGFQWGGDWDKSYYDYHHFQKELPDSYRTKYEQEVKRVLGDGDIL